MTPSPNIMVVEDSRTQAMRLRFLLEKQGWEVTWAPTVQAALDAIAQRRPDLMLVDLYLPDVGGDELCRRLRMDMNSRSIPIIMLTADVKHNAELQGLQSGADDFIPKSVDTDVLLLRVRSLLGKSARESAWLGQVEPRLQRATLLAIDDSATFLELLSADLERDGFSVEKVTSGQKGLERLQEQPFDCVLVDLVMPGMDGIAVCREIDHMRQSSDDPVAVLMLTAQENKDDLTRALEAGADDFVGKSSDLAVLKGRIRALLRRKFFQQEHRRILEELKEKELETIQARAGQEAAEARAQLYEELQRTAAELQRSNSDLQQFAYVVSHDLKEPLRMVTSFTSLLQEELGNELSDDAMRYMHYITEGAGRMHTLIDDLLEYSRVGRGQLEMMPVELDSLLPDVLLNLSVGIEESQAQVDVPRLPVVMGNSSLLLRLFQNLVGNAIKFHGSRPPRVAIDCERQEDGWLLSVRDNGIGIPAEHYERIFQIFQRLHGREEYEGTGVGLAICKKIVERHGGEIQVSSQVGQGTTFSFLLPAVSENETPPAHVAGATRRTLEGSEVSASSAAAELGHTS